MRRGETGLNKVSNGAHGVVFRHRTMKIFTETVKVSQKPNRTSSAPYQDLIQRNEYLIISGLDVFYLLCFGTPDR